MAKLVDQAANVKGRLLLLLLQLTCTGTTWGRWTGMVPQARAGVSRTDCRFAEFASSGRSTRQAWLGSALRLVKKFVSRVLMHVIALHFQPEASSAANVLSVFVYVTSCSCRACTCINVDGLSKP